MTRKRDWFSPAVARALAVVVAPVVWRAPEPSLSLPHDVRDLEEALDDCLGTRLDGWELVNYATALVNQKFTRYSTWHLWETSGAAFKNSRGYSIQYNLALGRLLAGLGYDVTMVYARRVQFDHDPEHKSWWQAWHTWLRVGHAGRTLDVCASREENRAGDVAFTPITKVGHLPPWGTISSRMVIAGPMIYQVWKSWITGGQVPRWVLREFHE